MTERDTNNSEQNERDPLKIKWGASTESAKSHSNDDTFLIDERARFAGVFDGVSGEEGASNASNAAKDAILKTLESVVEGPQHHYTKATIGNLLLSAEVFLRLNNVTGATTATIVGVGHDRNNPEQYSCTFGNVGDSRIYHFNSQGKKLTQISSDHSRASEIVDENDEPRKGEENFYYNERNRITDSLSGGRTKRPERLFDQDHVGMFTAQEGDLLILTTDGIHDPLTRKEIEAVLKDTYGKSNPDEIAAKLIQTAATARSKRAKDDDRTVVVVQLGDPIQQEPKRPFWRRSSSTTTETPPIEEASPEFEELRSAYVNLKGNPDSRDEAGFESLFRASSNIYNSNGLRISKEQITLKNMGEIDDIREALAIFLKSSLIASDPEKIRIGVNAARAFQYEENPVWREKLEVAEQKAQEIETERLNAEARRQAEAEAERLRQERHRQAEEAQRQRDEFARQSRERAENIRRQQEEARNRDRAEEEAKRKTEEEIRRQADEAIKRAQERARQRQQSGQTRQGPNPAEEAARARAQAEANVNPEHKRIWDEAKKHFNTEWMKEETRMLLRPNITEEDRLETAMHLIHQYILAANGDVSRLAIRSGIETLTPKVFGTADSETVYNFLRTNNQRIDFAVKLLVPRRERGTTLLFAVHLNNEQKVITQRIFKNLMLGVHPDNANAMAGLTDPSLEKAMQSFSAAFNSANKLLDLKTRN